VSALRTRIAGLVVDFGLPEGSGRQLRALLEAVERDPAAPTTVTDPARGVEVHVADSLDGLRAPTVRAARWIADLGAGAGFPGLVLAAALPAAQLHLVDSVGKKCAFIRQAAALAGLTNVEVVHARAEDWPEGTERHDVVTARAVAPLSVLVEYAAPLLALDGHLVAWEGRARRHRGGRRGGGGGGDGPRACREDRRPAAYRRRAPPPVRVREGRRDSRRVPPPGGNGPQTADLRRRVRPEARGSGS